MMKHHRQLATLLAAVAGATLTAVAAKAEAPEHILVAIQAGLTPESLTVAGYDATAAATMLSRIEALGALGDDLRQFQRQSDESDRHLTRTRTLLWHANTENAEDILDQAQADAAFNRTEERRHLDLFFKAAAANIEQGSVEMLQHWAAAADRRVPTAFKCLPLTPQEWDSVELALRAEERSQRLGEELDEQYAGLLAEIRGHSDVVAAEQSLQESLDAIYSVFEQGK